ncbi:MAG: hypothetical protein M0R77_11940 [Gammaproteobacteria bacterium]|jgi:nucleoside permease NupC|nr:hypothetical protein [Gammaproteobacteria bacterium]
MADRRLLLRVAAKLLAWVAIIAALAVLFGSLSPSPDGMSARPRAEARALPPPPP